MARIVPAFSFVLEIVDGVTDGVPITGEVDGFNLDPVNNQFSVTRGSDEFSPFLFQLLLTNEVLDTVRMLQESFVGDNLFTRTLFSFSNSIITSIQSTGPGSGRSESISFNFESVSAT